MDKPEQQDDIWDGAGPQMSEPTPTVICQFEINPAACTFPDCGCSDIPIPLRCTDVLPTPIEAIAQAAEQFEKRKPKRDRAKYMRDYRAQKKAAMTQ